MKASVGSLLMTASLFFGWFSVKSNCEDYAFPEATVRAFRSGGFEVSIPDTEGILLFAFHGNVNRELVHPGAGDFSGDIARPEGGRWVFRDRNARLKIGDKIHFWVFVQFKLVTYMRNGSVFEVKELIEKTSEVQEETHPETSTPQQSSTDTPLVACKRSLAKVTRIHLDLQDRVEELEGRNEILRDIVKSHPDISRSLTFGGRGVPQYGGAMEVAQDLVTFVLKLHVEVVNATRMGEEIAFEVGGIDDKIDVIMAQRHIFEGIEPPAITVQV